MTDGTLMTWCTAVVVGFAAFGSIAAAEDAPAVEVPFVIPAAEEEEEFGGLLHRPSPTPPPVLPPPKQEKPRKKRQARYGLRAGVVFTGKAEDGTWEPSFMAGVYYRRVSKGRDRLAFEMGFDLASVERDDDFVSSGLYSVCGKVLWGNWNMKLRKASSYALGGLEAVVENASFQADGETESGVVLGVKLGFGVAATTGAWDTRVVYSFFVGSDNVSGNVLLATGFAF